MKKNLLQTFMLLHPFVQVKIAERFIFACFGDTPILRRLLSESLIVAGLLQYIAFYHFSATIFTIVALIFLLVIFFLRF